MSCINQYIALCCNHYVTHHVQRIPILGLPVYKRQTQVLFRSGQILVF